MSAAESGIKKLVEDVPKSARVAAALGESVMRVRGYEEARLAADLREKERETKCREDMVDRLRVMRTTVQDLQGDFVARADVQVGWV